MVAKLYTRLGMAETRKVRALADALLEAESPCRHMRALALRCTAPGVDAFERYAGQVLRDAGALELASMPPSCAVHLAPPEEGRMARLIAREKLPEGMQSTLQSVEDAVNRIIDISDAVEHAELQASPVPRNRVLVSYMGLEYAAKEPEYRAAHVQLPPIALTAQPQPAYFNEIDWRTLDHVASNAHALFQHCLRPNKLQSVLGAYAPKGSDWDVRTRMAFLLERMELSLKFVYRFDCDVERQTVRVTFSAPPARSLPQWTAGDDGALKPVGERANQAHLAYVLRLACLMAAACFGTSRHIEHAYVVAETANPGPAHAPIGNRSAAESCAADEKAHIEAQNESKQRAGDSTGNPANGQANAERHKVSIATPRGQRLVACAFNRHDFVKNVLPDIDSGRLADSDLRFDPQGIVDIIRPQWFSCWTGEGDALRTRGGERGAIGDKPDDFDIAANRIDTWTDTRPISSDLGALFGAKRICDLDTQRYFGGNSQVIEAAKADARESTIAATAHLEAAISDMEQKVARIEAQGARPLFCANPFARIAVPLLYDELMVGDQAEEYLERNAPEGQLARLLEGLFDGRYDSAPFDRPEHAQRAGASPGNAGGAAGSSPADAPAPTPLFERAPNALFHAHAGLSDLLQKLGDFEGALSHADRCIALAPTTAAAYFRKADVLAQQTRHAEAANVLLSGLRCAVSKDDCALLYYHLALVLWQMGRRQDAVAIHVYTASLTGEFAERARHVLESLRKRDDIPVIAFASPLAAAREMTRARIPIAPSDDARCLVACAALGLTCANAPLAAAPYAAELARYLPDNRIVAAACASIVQGLR